MRLFKNKMQEADHTCKGAYFRWSSGSHLMSHGLSVYSDIMVHLHQVNRTHLVLTATHVATHCWKHTPKLGISITLNSDQHIKVRNFYTVLYIWANLLLEPYFWCVFPDSDWSWYTYTKIHHIMFNWLCSQKIEKKYRFSCMGCWPNGLWHAPFNMLSYEWPFFIQHCDLMWRDGKNKFGAKLDIEPEDSGLQSGLIFTKQLAM